MGFFKKLFSSLFKKVEQKVVQVTQQVQEVKPNIQETEKLGTTSDSWVPPPAPWPIDARFLSTAQISKLNAEETGRANMWQQAIMSSQGNMKQALYIFKAGYTKSEDLLKPFPPIWEQIFKAYGVSPEINKPVEGAYEWVGDYDPADVWKKPGDLGYPTREAMYAGRSPWLYKREQEKWLKEYGYNASHPYMTKPD